MPNIKKLTLEQEINLLNEYTTTRITEIDLAKKYKICSASIRKIRIRHNIPNRPKIGMNLIPCNENYFETIDTADKSYWLGFIGADGHLNDKDNTLYIGLAIKDKEILINFLKAIDSNHTIRNRRSFLKTTQKFYDGCSIEITRPKIISDLTKHGVGPNKSRDLYISKTIPDDLIKDFIRGYMDGDGTISVDAQNRISFSFVSSISSFAEEIRDHLIEKCKVNNNVISSKQGCVQIRWTNINQCKRIFDYLYSREPRLDRKYKIAKNYFDNPPKITSKARRPNSEIEKYKIKENPKIPSELDRLLGFV